MGKEQLILLPITPQVFELTTEPPGQVQLQSGLHAVVVSGYAGMKDPVSGEFGVIYLDVDDEEIQNLDVEFLIGPVWRDVSQVSASVAWAGIQSLDSDDVDESQWTISGCTWDIVEVADGKRIRLHVPMQFQGDENGWINVAYQVVATGDLKRMPTVDEISADL
jgi:hypothetical protein